MGNPIEDFLTSIIRIANIFDRDGLYKDDEDVCDHCGKLLLFSFSNLCEDCRKNAGYTNDYDDD